MKRQTVLRLCCSFLAVSLSGSLLSSCYNEPATVLQRMSDARRIAGQLHVEFSQSVNASNLAVMSTADEDSAAFARNANDKMQLVQQNAETLRPLLASLKFFDELSALEQFEKQFANYSTLNRSILELTVENTNLKAQRLSFGPVQDAAEAFRSAVEAPASGGSAESRVSALKAIAAVRQIQVLEAPHIAEADDNAMTRLEQKMSEAEATARNALKTLAPETNGSTLSTAEIALNRFMELHSQVIALSRRNSNIRSLALTLGQQRLLAAQCEDRLRALEEALSKRGFVATR